MTFARLFLAQKQSQAEAIVKYLAAERGFTAVNKGDHFIVGEDCVTFASGHLFEDAPPEHYDIENREWRREQLPIMPHGWVRLPKTRNTGGVEHEQLGALRRLMPQAQLIVHACDFDREGQLIGDEILEELALPTPVLRLPIVGYDFDSIRDACSRMVDNAEYKALSNAARARSRADWLIGINLTRALTLVAKDAGYQVRKLSGGRVISPTLCLLVKRAHEIAAFTPLQYYWVGIAADAPGGRILARWSPPQGTPGVDRSGTIVSRATAAEALTKARAHKIGSVMAITDEAVSEPPPLPFSLARLQMFLNERYRFTAQQTFDAAERLFSRHYAVSYPKGSGRYYLSAQAESAPTILHAIASNLPQFTACIGSLDVAQRSRAFDSTRVVVHPATAPLRTALDMRVLTNEERVVYEEICLNYLAQFALEHRFIRRTITLAFGEDRFDASFAIITEPGWKALRDPQLGATTPLFEHQSGQPVRLGHAELIERMTRAPEPFTDGTLIEALNSVEKHVMNPELKAQLGQGASIGSEARQALTIETLIRDGYAQRDRHYLVPTSIGRTVADHALPAELRGPGLTAILERGLDRIGRDVRANEPILVEVERLVRKMVTSVLATTLPPNTDWKTDTRDRKVVAHA